MRHDTCGSDERAAYETDPIFSGAEWEANSGASCTFSSLSMGVGGVDRSGRGKEIAINVTTQDFKKTLK
jgi:hypothetical protein